MTMMCQDCKTAVATVGTRCVPCHNRWCMTPAGCTATMVSGDLRSANPTATGTVVYLPSVSSATVIPPRPFCNGDAVVWTPPKHKDDLPELLDEIKQLRFAIEKLEETIRRKHG